MSENAFQAPRIEDLAGLFPQYEIESLIAQGGMGAVYKCRQLSLDREIAIKVLPREMGESEEFRESFTTEAKAMARLNHLNLLGVFDHGTAAGMPYIVMEYVDGGSLHQAAYNQAVEPSQAVAIVKGICDGLTHAHENGIVHRDIKPSNILLTPKLEPKVADFGLAHAADSDKPGLVMGTPGYTAPEVFQDPHQAGPLADIYSVGVILHQLLTGIDPAGSMTPPSQPTGNLRLDAIWRKATQLDPSQRYPGIAAMAEDLEKWIVAKRKPAVAVKPAPVRPVAVQAGGASAGKFFLIGILGALVVGAFLVLMDKKEKVNTVDADAGVSETHRPAPKPEPEPEYAPDPVFLPPVEDDPAPAPDPEPTETAASEEPEAVEDVDLEEPEPERPGSLEPGDPALRERAIGLIGDARKKRDKEFADNASALRFGLKSLSGGAELDVVSLIDTLVEDMVDHRIPQIDGVSGLPEKMAKVFKESLAKEESIDTRYRADLTRIRDAYQSRLKGAAGEASDGDLKDRLLAQAGEADDLDQWIAALSPEPEREVRKSSGGIAGGFTGNWDIHTEGRIERWIGHPDGKVEVVDRKWVGKWVIIEDGSLEIHWEGKKPYKLKQVSGEWIGKASFGQDVTMKRGDW